jgi:predicted PurR-regulated permease PerM
LTVTALGTFFQIGLMLLIAFLVSLDAHGIGRFLRSLAPTAYRSDVDAILAAVERMLYGYIKGQLVVALLIGLISGLAVWVIGLKYALVLGLLAGGPPWCPTSALYGGRARGRGRALDSAGSRRSRY